MHMHIIPIGRSEQRDGNQVGRYGRDMATGDLVFVWYQIGYGNDPRKWEMEVELEWDISISVDTIFIVDDERGLFALDRDAFVADDNLVEEAETEEYGVTEDAHYCKFLGHPDNHLDDALFIDGEYGDV